MNILILTAMALLTTPLLAQSDVEELLQKAETAINKDEAEPVKQPVVKKAVPKAKAPTPRVGQAPRVNGETELPLAKDPELAKLMSFERSKVATANSDRLIWSFAYVYQNSGRYLLEKDDDQFLVPAGQALHGMEVGFFPFAILRRDQWQLSSAFGLTYLSPDLRVERSGLVEESRTYEHRIVNFDMGLQAMWRLSDANSIAAGLSGSVASLMQDGDEENDTIFDATPGLRSHVGYYRNLTPQLNAGFVGGYRHQQLGQSAGPLHGWTVAIALGYLSDNG